MVRRLVFAGLVLAVTLVASTASAQVQSGSIVVKTVDQQGAVVPGAKVTITAVASGIETSVESNEQGFYSLTSLPPGAYTVAVTKSGFQTLRQTSLELVVQQVARLDLTLQVGQISETVEVRGHLAQVLRGHLNVPAGHCSASLGAALE